MKKRSRVLLVDDHPIFRKGLAQMVALEPDLMVCAEAEDTRQAVEAVATHRPDLVVVDVSLKDGDGIELVRELKAARPELRLLVLSMHDEVLYADRALRAGALGYVMKRASTGEVVQAMRQALAGEIYVSADIKNRLLQRIAGNGRMAGSALEKLSDRELEIHRLFGEGLNLRQIAKQLHICPGTVGSHADHIKTKLGLKTGAELTRHALRWADQLTGQ